MSRYPPQGSVVGPPPMPNKTSRSPERQRRPSPGYDRDAEWRRFQEWEKRNRKSPLATSPRSPPRRPPSPRKEHSPPPPDWVRRSPPRSYQPPEWGRRSPPPAWPRRSPPRYGPPPRRSPPRGRSPPRWGRPPPEWDRYRNGPPRRSPPRHGPPPHWDSRRERRPPSPQERRRWPPQHSTVKPPTARPNGAPQAPVLKASELRPSPEGVKMDDVSGEDDNLENYDLPEYDAEVPLGQKYVIAVSGFFCKICHKFYNSESSAKVTHCKSKTHYDKFAKWINDKKEESQAQNRSADPQPPAIAIPAPVPAPLSTITPQQEDEEPVAKKPKLEPTEIVVAVPAPSEEEFESGLVVKEEVNDESDGEQSSKQYNPLEPTAVEVAPPTVKEEHNTSASETTSDAEKSMTDGDFLEATLYNFRKMRVQQLKENLQKRDLPTNGLKPLLLKRLEKALLAEAADTAAAENEEEEESKEQQDETTKSEASTETKEEDPQAGDATQESKTEGEPEPMLLKLMIHESDIEVSNKKTQWITERELERELLQMTGVEKVISMERQETKMGKKTIVEWTIQIDFKGEFPADGLNFWMESHQQLPFRVSPFED